MGLSDIQLAGHPRLGALKNSCAEGEHGAADRSPRADQTLAGQSGIEYYTRVIELLPCLAGLAGRVGNLECGHDRQFIQWAAQVEVGQRSG